MILQALNLKVGESAVCAAGYPQKSTLIVKCIKDFNYQPGIKGFDNITDNPNSFLTVVNCGLFGPLTSHWISGEWEKEKTIQKL